MRTHKFLGMVVSASASLLMLCSCATPSKLYPPIADDHGVSRLGEVMVVATKQEILSLGVHYQNLLASGISEADLRDGSMVEARVYCCGGNIEQSSAPWVYVPPGVEVAVGDIIEIKMGQSPGNQSTGRVNTVIRVRQRGMSSGQCRWVPDNPALWMRVLYCDWMKEEGWVEREGLYNAWLKR
jgi:hypothetical protein